MNAIDEHERLTAALRSFVPPDAFDIHAHLYRRGDTTATFPAGTENPDGNAGAAAYRRAMAAWLGEAAPTAGLFFAFPSPSLDMAAANAFVADEVQRLAGSRGLMLVQPGDDPAHVEADLTRHGWAGFKVYHCYAARSDTFEAEIGEFLPDWAWELVDRRGLAIMLHIVRSRALADPLNQDYIVDRCRRFPGARLILAHAARGFCGHHTVLGIAALRGLDNVFFDTSAICEPAPLEAILREFGPSRLLFGTDFPVCELRGKCVSIGDSFAWLYADSVQWPTLPPAQPVRVGIESLLALEQACRTLRLDDSDVECIFRTNARELLSLGQEQSAGRTDALYERAKRLIPGGTQLLSKRPEMYAPGCWPAYFREARGCEVIDLDGRRLIDMTTVGIGACLLGYADPDVTAAVERRVALGSMCTLNPPEEVELAELLLSIHPWAEQARFTRSGGEAMAVAVRIARAATGHDTIAFCGYHGWSDWYLAANLPSDGATAEDAAQTQTRDGDRLASHLLPGLEPAGVPRGLAGTMLPFAYNRLDELERHVATHGHRLAAVVMEPTRSTVPAPGFLEGVRALCDLCGALLVLDEISSAWRLHRGGAHLAYGVDPDIAVLAKATSNGHPLGAILGRRRAMQAAETTFISSTYWTEAVGPAAALATVRKMVHIDVPGHVERIGRLMQDGWRELGRRHGVPAIATGHPALLHLGFDHADAAALGTLVTVRMLERGFLAGANFYPSLAHTPQHVETFLAATDPVFAELSEALRRGDALERIGGRMRHAGFRRLT